ncbi:FCH domain only protein 2 [Aphelenchoides fujianensis]|nr:FCH domain only protein 2 [Aphelenchoides fujianensis]
MAIGDYADHFWGDRHIGYHVLYDNLKRNEQAIDELNLFVKDNISIQDDFLKFLGKTVNRLNSFIANNGPFVDSWRLTKGTFELWVEIQTTLVKNLADLSKEVVKFHDEQVKSRKRIRDQDVIDAVNLMQTTTTCLQKAKETYQQRSNEMVALGSENVGGKEFVKAKSKLVRAHEEYRTYVEKYAGVRDDFEQKMLKSAAAFQTHDSAFLQQFKQHFAHFARHLNDSQNAISQVSGDYSQSLERVDVQQIMLRFIEERGTGTERPQVIRWSDSDEMPVEFEGNAHTASSLSAPSSSNSSAVVAGPPAENATPTVNDLLSINSAWGTDVNSLKSPTDSDSEPAHHASNTNISSSYVPPQLSSWLGRGKIGNWRKKHASQSNLSTTPTEAIGDFSQSYNENKGQRAEMTATITRVRIQAGFYVVTASRKNSGSETPAEPNRNTMSKEDVHGLGAVFGGANGKNEEHKYEVDAEGFTIRKESTAVELPERWSSGSSSEEEDESEFQTSKIKALQIKPLNSATKMAPDSSIEEIKNAVGHMSLRRSSTLDKDPWCPTNSQAPAFSQSLNTATFTKPLRSAFTGDDSINRKFRSSSSRAPRPPSASTSRSPPAPPCSPAATSRAPGLVRTRRTRRAPLRRRISRIRRVCSAGRTRSERRTRPPSECPPNSLGSLMNLSGWAGGDQTASNSASPLFFNAATTGTLNRVKIPIAMGINEYVHAWFKGDAEKTVVRVFGTVMVSVPASFINQLTDDQDAREPLKFSLKNAAQLKTVQPNSRLLNATALPALPQEVLTLTIPKQQLANFVFEQQQSKPNSDFYNVDLLRYELNDSFEAPLFVNSYWKTEATHTDLRIDYALNTSENTLTTPLINVRFEVRVDGKVESYNSDPEAKWNGDTQTLSFSLTELTRHGGSTGSLKARLKLTDGPSKPAQTVIHFQTSNATASNVAVQLESDSAYQLSLVRRKVLAGTYLSDPQART